ncbi:MAG: SRPBCC domain-containing protein [Pyrinomonadaceae bacterium]
MEHELVFKALGDASRRRLLDLLFLKDGRSLSELEEHLPMTRFGVMKHLRNLRDAGLVTTQKSGRETLHFLNAVPIQMVYDRWVSKYSKGWARSLTELKYDLEAVEMAEAKKAETTRHVFEVYIKTTPEKLWQALTDGTMTEKYYYGLRAESDWKSGSPYKYCGADGTTLLDGTVVESDPPKRLVTTFNPRWSPDSDVVYPESRVTYEITETGGVCKLTLVHDDLAADNPMTEGIFRGWSEILSGLKTLLETGQPLMAGPADQQQ